MDEMPMQFDLNNDKTLEIKGTKEIIIKKTTG